MHVLVCHNRYRSSLPSGEDAVAARELAWLQAAPGVSAEGWFLESDALLRAGWLAQVRTGLNLPGSEGRRREFVAQLCVRRPDLIHAHNLWPLFTFDLIWAAGEVGIPLVLTLHNHRLYASNRRRIVAGKLVAPRNPAEAVEQRRLGACHGPLAELAYRRMLARIWQEGRPQRHVAKFICMSRFQHGLAVAAGLPSERITLRPNACPDPGRVGSGPGKYALFVGRLDRSKGIAALVEAWLSTGLPLKVVGSGPEEGGLMGSHGVEILGRQSPVEVAQLMAGARFLVMNSGWHEVFPLVVLESFACGTPALVPALGALSEMVGDGVRGRVFRAGDRQHLIEQARRLWEEAPALRPACRLAYEMHYTPELGRASLLRIYETVLRGGSPP